MRTCFSMLLAPIVQLFEKESSPCLSNVWKKGGRNSVPCAMQKNGTNENKKQEQKHYKGRD